MTSRSPRARQSRTTVELSAFSLPNSPAAGGQNSTPPTTPTPRYVAPFGLTRPVVLAWLLVAAPVVFCLSLAGDVHGASTPAALPSATHKWTTDCQLTGVSATTGSLGCAIAAALVSVVTGFCGLVAAGAARHGFELLRFRAPGVASGSLSAAVLMWLARLLLGAGLATFAVIVPKLARGLPLCSACYDNYAAWLSTPRTSTAGLACPLPAQLSAVPAGVQTTAGLLCALGLAATARYGSKVRSLVRLRRVISRGCYLRSDVRFSR